MLWLARNRVALAVIAVCVPGLVGVLFGFEMLSRDANAVEVREIAVGDSVTAAGYSWKLTESIEFVGEGRAVNDIPVGTSLVAAIVTVTPVDNSSVDDTCDVSLVGGAGSPAGDELSWRTVSDVSLYDYARRPESASYCSLDGEAFSYEAVFLAPTGVYDEATVEFVFGSSDTVYRFDLKH